MPITRRNERAGADQRVGVEVDGSLLRVVRVEGDRPVGFERVIADDAGDLGLLARAAVAGRASGAVAWSSPGIVIRRAPLPGRADRRMVPVAREMLDRHLPGAGHLPAAGVVQPTDGRTIATFGAITAEPAAQLVTALSGTRCRVLISPFTLTLDGLYLAIRHSCAELTLVTSGIAVATHQMRVGGLMAALGAPLMAMQTAEPAVPGGPDDGDGDLRSLVAAHRVVSLEAGAQAIDTTLQRVLLEAVTADVGDSEIMAAARRYEAALARAVHRTVEHWERGGQHCPRTLWVCGPGAELPNLRSYMHGLGYAVGPPPLPDGFGAGGIDERLRVEAYGALMAALHPVEQQPLAQFDAAAGRSSSGRSRRAGQQPPETDPLAGFEGIMTSTGTRTFASPLAVQQDDAPTPRGLAIGVLVALLIAVLGVSVWWSEGRALDDAEMERARLERVVAMQREDVAEAARVATVAEAVRSLGEPSAALWSVATEALLTSLPADPVIERLEFTPGVNGLAATITLPATGIDLVRWRSDLAMTGASISTEEVDDRVVFTLVFRQGTTDPEVP